MKRKVRESGKRTAARPQASLPPAARRCMEGELRAAEERIALSALDALATHIAILGADGTILATNKAWRGCANSGCCDRGPVGANYFAHSEGKAPVNGALAPFAEGVRAVIQGRPEF